VASPAARRTAAQAAVAALVARFRRLTVAQRRALNEQETRVQFILPLFRALGWNIEDGSEMTAEESISGGFVDFGFYLNGIPVFYVETKRVGAGVSQAAHMKQAINYAYMKGVTWAVLTDFESLSVFNADIEDKNPDRARFLTLGCDTYATADFDQLWLLSREAMLTRAIDARAAVFGRTRLREPVTTVLFRQLTAWRKDLFNVLRLNSDPAFAADPAAIDDAVQKLIDRLIFLRTAEDRRIETSHLKEIVRDREHGRYWPRLVSLFSDMNAVYNSNLFAPHTLDKLTLNDPGLVREIIGGLYQVPGRLAQYNFAAIDADVLGAVYEQYLGFRAADPDARRALTGKQNRRHAQGIYYTPQYIVRYIVQATVGRRLREGADPHTLTVVDPACGSGSFLIEAFRVLDRWLATAEPEVPAAERRRRILTENLYGVDLDPQAVEVTRLNLVLQAALERGRLPMLTHIIHGDSLVKSAAHTARPIDWAERFAPVIERGGFDVVLGNPPYVRGEQLSAAFKQYAEAHYETYAGAADLYVYFMEHGLKLLRPGGLYGVIVANRWLRARYGTPLRAWLKTQTLHELIDFGELPVFSDAATFPVIITARRQPPPTGHTLNAIQMKTLDFNDLEVHLGGKEQPLVQSTLNDRGWSLSGVGTQAVIEKMRKAGVPLGEFSDVKIYRGIVTGLNEAFVIDDAVRRRLIAEDPASATLIKPFLAGRDLKRYETPTADKYIIFARRGVEIDRYPAIRAHLETFRTRLTPKPRDHVGQWGGRKAGNYPWYELQDSTDYYTEFEKPKIIYPDIALENRFALDQAGHYLGNTCYMLSSSDPYLYGVFSSKLVFFFLKQISSILGDAEEGGRLRLHSIYIQQVPIPRIDPADAAQTALHARITGYVARMIALRAERAAALARAPHADVFGEQAAEYETRTHELDGLIDAAVYQLYGLSDAEAAVVAG
jgi:hypothetical protein